MKITAVILLATCLQAAAAGYGQKVTISEKDAPVEKIFGLIRKQTGFQFLYANQVLAQARKVTIQVKNAELEDVLAATFQGQPFEYHIKDKTIIVRMRPAPQAAAAVVQQPPIDVRGRVVNAQGEPVAGATVTVEGSKKSTVTNANGEFTFTGISENAVLQISHVQYEGEAIVLNGRSTVNATLQVKVSSLDEMQVIAYGTTTKRLNTGNVATVKASDIEKQPVNNPLLALQGRVPGLTVTQSTGSAGSAVTIRVQGRSNLDFFSGSDPLIVIDGVPYPGQNLQTFSGGTMGSDVLGASSGTFSRPGSTLSFINPADIESIDVLKDADATAIYGSRGANGVILITTKKGKAGALKADFNIQYGIGQVAKKIDLLNAQQYLDMRKEAFRNDNLPLPSITTTPNDANYDINGLWDTTRYTDWQKELIGGTAKFTRVSASVSGGTSNVNYLISGTYGRETTVFPGDFKDKRGSLHFNLNGTSSDKRFEIQLSGSFMSDNNNLPSIDYTQLITLSPVAPPLYNEDGTINWAPNPNGNSSWTNPLSYNYNLMEIRSNNLVSNSVVRYHITSGLEVRASMGYNQLLTDQFIASMDGAFAPEQRSTLSRSATFNNNAIRTWIIEPQVNYKITIGRDGKLDALIGSTFQEQKNSGVATQATGQNSDQLLRNRGAATSLNEIPLNTTYRYSALFGRLGYNFANRYLLNLSARKDGSSRFGSDNNFHFFGAIGVGWIFSQERLIKNNIPFLSFGKLRGSYGTIGNDQIDDYQFMSLYSSTRNAIPYQTVRGLMANGIANPSLQWEEAKKLQAGIDLGFIHDRILLSATYVRNRTSNSLTNVKLPVIAGASAVVDNFPALIQNTAWEFSVRTDNVKTKAFSWSTVFNLTIPKNKLVSYPGGLESSLLAGTLEVGKPLNIIKDYSFYGVDPATGGYLLYTANGDITTTPSYETDRIAILNVSEQFYGGLQNSISYKNFQIDFLFQFTKQDGYDFWQVRLPGAFTYGIWGNESVKVLERWQKPGDETSMARFTTNSSSNPIYGNRSFKDISYVRLKNASLSYQIPARICERIKVSNLRAYVNGQNLVTITNYQGLDPETKNISTLPPLRMVTVGVQVGL